MSIGLLGRLATALDAAGVPYMIIGGQAVLLYGEPRLTRDVDVTVGLDLTGLPELLKAAGAADLSVLVEDPDRFVKDTFVLPAVDEESGLRVNFILSMTSYEQEAISRAREVKVGEATVRFATPEDVIVHKVFSGRPRDIEDVRSVLSKQRDIDRSYVEEWLSQFDRDVLGRGFVETFRQVSASSWPG